MLPLIGAKVEKETKDGFDLWCEEGRLNVAEKKSEDKWKVKIMKTSPITNSLKSLQKSEPEEEQLELNCEVGVCQQVMQRIEIPAGQK